MKRLRMGLISLVAGTLLGGPAVGGETTDPYDLLAGLGLAPEQIAEVKAGEQVRWSVESASERELVAALAFRVEATPAEILANEKVILLDPINPSVRAYGLIPDPASVDDFAKLVLEPGARAEQYLQAGAGDSLNLSADEIASFAALGDSAGVSAVEAQVRSALLDRLNRYRAEGLAGIAPYARKGGGVRSPAEELRLATEATRPLREHAPDAYQALLSYPEGVPPGTEERFFWSQIDAEGTPTITLSHLLLVPDGEDWTVAHRQFYVSSGYNAEQDVSGFLAADGGTLIVYINRTSTDQVTGFGGGAKRGIGSSLLASKLEALLGQAREAVE